MTSADFYRSNAAAERRAAEETRLPRQREMHERSAMTWEEMAERSEDTHTKAKANAAANAAAATLR